MVDFNDRRSVDREYDWSLVGDHRRFHGTRQEVKGKTLKPSAKTGKENYDYDSFADGSLRRSNVFFTQYVDSLAGEPEHSPEARAWRWGTTGTHNAKGRPRVYEVQPRGEIKKDTVLGAAMAPEARIKKRIDIPPAAAVDHMRPSENWQRVPGGVQGTLPMADWDTHVDKERRHQNEIGAVNDEWKRIQAEKRATRISDFQGRLFKDRRYGGWG